MESHEFISEKEAAEKMGYAPLTLRAKVLARQSYKGHPPLKISYTTGTKGYCYSKNDIEKLIAENIVTPEKTK